MKRLRSFINTFLTATILLSATSSCDSFIYDDEGDCAPYYKVRFVYDMNMKYADAFAHEVNEVTLYVVDDATGKIVWQKHESGAALSQAGYAMDVDVAPGNYSLIAWCGEGHTTHFSVADAEHHTGLNCTLQRERDDNGDAHIKNDLNRLYHGRLEAQVFPDTQGVHYYTVSLVKNTNDIHVVLQHLSGEPVDPDMFAYNITDANGKMDYDNSLMDDETLTYHPWHVSSASADIEWPEIAPESRVQSQFSAAVADLTTSRLVKGQDAVLTVWNKEKNERVLAVPLIKYALMVKGHYREMDDQEYLDRQDDYSMVFFLDEGNRWLDSRIFINSWEVVLQNTDI